MDQLQHGTHPNAETFQTFLDGSKRSRVKLETAAIGVGTYHPGWRHSEHTAPQSGKASQHHIGYILSGWMAIQAKDGTQAILGPGHAFEVAPEHDAWVVGDESCIAFDFRSL